MIVPYSTDAPIYHLPIATVGVIVVTTGIFFACAMRAAEVAKDEPTEIGAEYITEMMSTGNDEDVDPYEAVIDPWILHYGTFNPLQWITSNFMHADFLHVFGNMAGLWGLGLIVEGKVGWWRFLLMYLGIGATQSGIEQTMMLGASGGASLGASAVVYGMLVVALLWAPKNDLSCLIWFGFRPFVTDVSVPIYAAMLMGLELVLGIFSNFSFGSTILHLMGAGVGLVLGLVMLRMKWVDCEGFDFISEFKKNRGIVDKPKAPPKEVVTPEQLAQRRQMGLSQIQELIAGGNVKLALVAHERMKKEYLDWQLPAALHVQLIASMHKAELWSESMPVMVDYLKRHSERAAQVRLQLAKLLIERENRPSQAMKVIAKIDPAQLDEKLQKYAAQLKRKADALVEEGEVEMATEDW